MAFSVFPLEGAASSMTHLGGAPSCMVHISLAQPSLANGVDLNTSLGTRPARPPLGSALPEQGYQKLDPLLDDWAGSRSQLLQYLLAYQPRPQEALPFFTASRTSLALLAEDDNQ